MARDEVDYYFYPEKYDYVDWSKEDKWVIRTNDEINLTGLIQDYFLITKTHDINNTGQLCLTHLESHTSLEDKLYGGCGILPEDHSEFDFRIFNEEFKDTDFYKLFQVCSENWEVGRMRLMQLQPHSCYSMHRDRSVSRFHLALITNRNCHIAYQKGDTYHIPADGYVYEMNSQEEHTAFNAGESPRIHLVYELQDKTVRN